MNPGSNPNMPRARGPHWGTLLIGLILGGALALCLVLFVGMPLALGHRSDLPFERQYGSLAVGMLANSQAGAIPNPAGQNPRAIESGRNAYTGSCAVCHGANGDGKGEFGQAVYPPATDLTKNDTQSRSDAALFWIIKNGLSFAGMPAFAKQYNDQGIWNLVSYTRSLKGKAASASGDVIPTPTADQLAMADPQGDSPHRGASVYYAAGCQYCHGPVGNAPGELRLREGGREADQAVRRGRNGMPAYGADLISDAQLADLQAYMGALGGGGD